MIQSHISNVLIPSFSSLASQSQCFDNSLSALNNRTATECGDWLSENMYFYLSSRPNRLRYIYQNAIPNKLHINCGGANHSKKSVRDFQDFFKISKISEIFLRFPRFFWDFQDFLKISEIFKIFEIENSIIRVADPFGWSFPRTYFTTWVIETMQILMYI